MRERPGDVAGRDRGRVAELLAHGGRQRADRVPLRELLQPGGQAGDRDERARDEREREDDQEADAHHRVRRAHRDADEQPDPHHREREAEHQPVAGERVRDAVVDPPADDQAADAEDRDRDHHPGELGEHVADEERASATSAACGSGRRCPRSGRSRATCPARSSRRRSSAPGSRRSGTRGSCRPARRSRRRRRTRTAART